MKSRVALIAAAPVLAVLAAACSSTVSGSGTGTLAASSSSPSTSAAPTTPSSTVASKTSSSVPASKSSATAPSSKSSSSAPLGPATLLTLTATSPACGTSTTDKKQITIKWTSKNSTEVWIESGPVATALQGADPMTDSNGQKLVNPDSGSVPAEYDCANANYYYLVEFYNTSNSTKSGQVQQVPSN